MATSQPRKFVSGNVTVTIYESDPVYATYEGFDAPRLLITRTVIDQQGKSQETAILRPLDADNAIWALLKVVEDYRARKQQAVEHEARVSGSKA